MRFALTLVMFVVVGSTLAGILVIALLASPVAEADVFKYLPWVAAGGFAAALPISFVVANNLLSLTKS